MKKKQQNKIQTLHKNKLENRISKNEEFLGLIIITENKRKHNFKTIIRNKMQMTNIQ